MWLRNIVFGVVPSVLTNPFEILSIRPPRLCLSLLDLERDYHCLALLTHPDRNRNDDALARSSALNAAYKTVKDPWLRAAAFLALTNFEDEPGAKRTMDLAEAYFDVQESEDPLVLETFVKDLENRLEVLAGEREGLFKMIDDANIFQESERESESASPNIDFTKAASLKVAHQNAAVLIHRLKNILDFKKTLDSMLRDCRARLHQLRLKESTR